MNTQAFGGTPERQPHQSDAIAAGTVPDLKTTMHLDMYAVGKSRRRLLTRLGDAMRTLRHGKLGIYGMEWGDPEALPPLMYIRDHYILPYVSPGTRVVEIGAGGGRWTRYLLPAETIYAVDYHEELLDELRANIGASNIVHIRNNGDDFPGIAEGTIDFLFTFGVFVHLEMDIIDRYLRYMKPLLRPSANVVIQYSDKTKPLGQMNRGFSDNDPDRMRALVASHGYVVYEEDLKTMWHSSVIRFGVAQSDPGPAT